MEVDPENSRSFCAKVSYVWGRPVWTTVKKVLWRSAAAFCSCQRTADCSHLELHSGFYPRAKWKISGYLRTSRRLFLGNSGSFRKKCAFLNPVKKKYRALGSIKEQEAARHQDKLNNVDTWASTTTQVIGFLSLFLRGHQDTATSFFSGAELLYRTSPASTHTRLLKPESPPRQLLMHRCLCNNNCKSLWRKPVARFSVLRAPPAAPTHQTCTPPRPNWLKRIHGQWDTMLFYILGPKRRILQRICHFFTLVNGLIYLLGFPFFHLVPEVIITQLFHVCATLLTHSKQWGSMLNGHKCTAEVVTALLRNVGANTQDESFPRCRGGDAAHLWCPSLSPCLNKSLQFQVNEYFGCGWMCLFFLPLFRGPTCLLVYISS